MVARLAEITVARLAETMAVVAIRLAAVKAAPLQAEAVISRAL